MASVSNRLCACNEIVGTSAQTAASKKVRRDGRRGLMDCDTEPTSIAFFAVDWRSTWSSCIAVFTPDSKQRMCHRENASAQVVHLRQFCGFPARVQSAEVVIDISRQLMGSHLINGLLGPTLYLESTGKAEDEDENEDKDEKRLPDKFAR